MKYERGSGKDERGSGKDEGWQNSLILLEILLSFAVF